MVLMIAAMLLQFVLLYGSLFFGGAMGQLRSNAFDILNERIMSRRNNLEDDMIQRWANLGDSATAVNHEIESLLAESGSSTQDLTANSPLSTQALENASDRLLYLLRRNTVTGVFLIFNGSESAEMPPEGEMLLRAGLYIRDYDPESNPDDYSDLMLDRCPSALAQRLGITLDTNWQPQFSFSSDSGDYFYKPYRAALESSDAEPSDLGYWCPTFTLGDDANPVITYSQPLITGDGVPYGVIGIEISTDYLTKQLPYAEINGDKQGSYLLAIDREDDEHLKFERAASSGPYYTRIFGGTSSVSFLDEPVMRDCYEIADNSRIEDTAYGCIEYLQLYNTNTPFVGERWALIGVIEERDLLGLYNNIQSFILLTLAAVFLIGIASACFVSIRFAHPITALAQKVRGSDPQAPVHLGKINIAEIDELSSSIEALSRNVAEFSSKLSTIIRMAGYQIAAFEWRFDSNHHIFLTDSFLDIIGMREETEKFNAQDEESFRRIMRRLEQHLEQETDDGFTRIYHLLDDDGKDRWVRLKVVQDELRMLGVVTDITSEAAERKMIEYERDYDLLTNLLNRRAFHTTLTKAFQNRDQMAVAAIVMLDLDNLKYINDTYGHDCGDQYIRCAADVLRQHASSSVVVARMSGDEFFVFLRGETRDEINAEIRHIEESFHQARLKLPDGQTIRVRLSAGVAWYPDDADTFQQLIRYADFAMYRVKHTTKGEFAEFDLNNYNQEGFLLNSKEELNKLIEDELVTYQFQPIVSARDGSVFAYEALMRPMLDAFQSPLDVLAMARSQSKLYQIERLTFYKAFEVFSKYSPPEEDYRIFINSIPNQFLSVEDILKLDELYHPYLHRLVMELTEEEKPDDNLTRKKRDIMDQWGAEIALDDFGAGYNGDTTLLIVQPNYIKVDKMIVHCIDQDEKRLDILKGILTFARTHGAFVIAEGVETREELETLVRNHVDFVQGYYVGYPSPKPSGIPEEIRSEIQRLNEAS